MRRCTLGWALWLGLATVAVRSAAAAAPFSPDLELLAGWMTGNFSSQAQAQRDSSFFDIRLTIAPIWKARRDARWFYVEQARGDKLDRPYRQRVYRVRESEPGVFESTVFTLPAPLRFVGAWKQALPLGTLTPDSLQERRGCAVYLHRRDHSFVGSTQGKDCPSELRGAAYATSEVRIDAAGMTTLDRGFDAAGQQVWGSTRGAYVFVRVEEP